MKQKRGFVSLGVIFVDFMPSLCYSCNIKGAFYLRDIIKEINIYENNHREISREIASEGMVLLKNNGCLPLGKTLDKIALFGIGARHTIKGGTGSGDVNVRNVISVEKGLEFAGYDIVTKKYLDNYDKLLSEENNKYKATVQALAEKGVMAALGSIFDKPFKAPDAPAITKKDCDEYSSKTAIYVLSRNSGEGADRKNVKGDYLLSDNEISDITLLSQNYDNLILLLNVGGAVDISKVYNLTGAILLIGQAGASIGTATADILTGKVTPSGKLTATWAKHYSDYPCADDFANGDIWNTEYKEDIFVGYRHFDKNKIKALFPFGFGLSYTSFDIDTKEVKKIDNRIVISICVTNTGNKFSGKEVVQIYAQQPKGIKSKAEKLLVAFKKTKTLAPGESETLSVSFSINDLAIYDEEISAWHIEKGKYKIYSGNSSDKILFASIINLEDNVFPVNSFIEVFDKETEDIINNLSRDEAINLVVGNARTSLTDFSVIGNASKSIPGAAGETTDILENYGIGNITMADGPAGLRINSKVYKKDGMYINNPEEDPILSLVLPKKAQSIDLSGTEIEYRYCTALPCETMLAQSWNTDLLFKCGDIIGREMELMGIDLWLAPGMNIQRNPLCGRNFEYFSEDPLLTGKCASYITKGVQSHKNKGVTLKHFACNNRENNRNYNNSIISERALREIYLKGFEICVKEARPFAVMSAYNLINSEHCSNSSILLTSILRNEWGFDGIVMTDWYATQEIFSSDGKPYTSSDSALCINAGNDLIMPGSTKDIEKIRSSLNNGLLHNDKLILSAKRIFKTIRRCGK